MGAAMKLNDACALQLEIDDTADEACVFAHMLKISKKLDVEVYGKYRDKEIYVMPYDSVFRITRRYHGLEHENI